VFALVVIGPPGAGKSAVLEALSDALVVDDVRHATVETEALTSAHPALDNEQWQAPVRAVCALYRQFGYELMLIAATVEAERDLRDLLTSIGADEAAVVRLHAELATLRRRIEEREPEGWSGLDDLLEATARLAPAVAGLEGVALDLTTDGQARHAVAERIRDSWPAQLRPEAG
jgi:adenylate kinase family enzyme